MMYVLRHMQVNMYSNEMEERLHKYAHAHAQSANYLALEVYAECRCALQSLVIKARDRVYT